MQVSPEPIGNPMSSKISIVGIFALLTFILTIPLVVLLSQENQTYKGNAEVGPTPQATIPVLKPGNGSISGYVFLDDNKNGIRDPEEKPFPNASLKITQINPGNNSGQQKKTDTGSDVTTDSNGFFTYSFSNLLPDSTTYLVTLNIPAGYKTISTNPLMITDMHRNDQKIVAFGLFPYVPGIPPVISKPACAPRPACLDSKPRCLISEPVNGWCPGPSGIPLPTKMVPPVPQNQKIQISPPSQPQTIKY